MKSFFKKIAIVALGILGLAILLTLSVIAGVLILLRNIFEWPYRAFNSLYQMLSALVRAILTGVSMGLKKEKKITIIGDVSKQEEK